MQIKTRPGVFESNSSSSHSLTGFVSNGKLKSDITPIDISKLTEAVREAYAIIHLMNGDAIFGFSQKYVWAKVHVDNLLKISDKLTEEENKKVLKAKKAIDKIRAVVPELVSTDQEVELSAEVLIGYDAANGLDEDEDEDGEERVVNRSWDSDNGETTCDWSEFVNIFFRMDKKDVENELYNLIMNTASSVQIEVTEVYN